MNQRTCKIEDCDNIYYAKGKCSLHYNREQYQTNINVKNAWRKYSRTKRKKLIEEFGGRCCVCDEEPNYNLKKINLEFHHKYYENGRTQYIKDIDQPNSKGLRILNEVEKHPERFELVCKDCHIIKGIIKKNRQKVEKCLK